MAPTNKNAIIPVYHKDSFGFYTEICDEDGKDLSAYPWRITLRTSPVATSYEASFDGSSYRNAHRDSRGLHIVVEHHKMHPGAVSMEIETSVPDECFSGGFRRVHRIMPLPFRIVSEPPSADSSDVFVRIIMPEAARLIVPILDEIAAQIEAILGEPVVIKPSKSRSAALPLLTRGIIPYTADPNRVYRNTGEFRYTNSQAERLGVKPNIDDGKGRRLPITGEGLSPDDAPLIVATAPGVFKAYRGAAIHNSPELPLPSFPTPNAIMPKTVTPGGESLRKRAISLRGWLDEFWPDHKKNGRPYFLEVQVWDGGGKKHMGRGNRGRNPDGDYYEDKKPYRWRRYTECRGKRLFGTFRIRMTTHNGKNTGPWLRVSFSPYGITKLG